MKVKSLIILPLVIALMMSSLINAGCIFPTGDTKDLNSDITYHLKFDSIILADENGKSVGIEYDVNYKDDYFSADGKTYNKDLAIISLSSAIVASYDKQEVKEFYQKLGFDNIVQSKDYDLAENKDTICYNIAHKKIGTDDLIAVSIKGLNYFKPWANNVTIGTNGHATGFLEPANKVLNSLKSYIEQYQNENLKYWITGYSRSAGIANIVADEVLDNDTYKASEENMYAYLFCTPKVMEVPENGSRHQHASIHNVVNKYDLVTRMFPDSYGLSRVGVDEEIYCNDLDDKVKLLNSSLQTVPFLPNATGIFSYSTEEELCTTLIENLLTESLDNPDDEYYQGDASTRENYSRYVEESLSYVLEIALSLKPTTQNQIMEGISELDAYGLMGLLFNDGFYEFIKPILDENGETYDAAKLKNSLNKIINFVGERHSALIVAFINEEEASKITSSVMRLLSYHSPEVVFAAMVG